MEKKSGRIFGVRQVLNFTKSCQQIWGHVNQPFIYIIVLWGAVLSYSPRKECISSQLHSFNIQDDRSTRKLLAKPLKKFPKSPIRPAGSHFQLAPNLQWELSVWMSINRVTLQHNKELIMFFYLMVLELCVIFKSVWYSRHFDYSCAQGMFMNYWKQTGQRLKLRDY